MPSQEADTPKSRRRWTGRDDISPNRLPNLTWDQDALLSSLAKLYEQVETQAMGYITWYLKDRRTKSRWSRLLRAAAVLLAAIGSIIPILAATDEIVRVEWGYIFLAAAAACVALDRYFGLSSAWMRYLTTELALQRLLREFQLDWTALNAQLGGSSPGRDQLEEMLQRIKTFSLDLIEKVELETLSWVAEFQSNFAQLELAVHTTQDTPQRGRSTNTRRDSASFPSMHKSDRSD